MTSLIKRLEALTGPSREVDAEIAKATGWESVPWEFAGTRGVTWYASGPEAYKECPHFTGSIDAALTLMPATLKNTVLLQTSSPAKAGFGRDGKKFTYFEGVTAPIALCIAALKAREVINED